MISFPSDAFAVRSTNETAPYAWVVRSYDPSNGPQESAHGNADDAKRVGMHVWSQLAGEAQRKGWSDRSLAYTWSVPE